MARKNRSRLPFEYVVEIEDYITKFPTSKSKTAVLSGNSIYNNRISKWARNTQIKEAKKYFNSMIRKAIKKNGFKIPKEWWGNVAVRIEFHDKSRRAWDCDNKWVYHKIIQDCFVDIGLIPDDNNKYIIDGGRTVFIQRSKTDNRPKLLRIVVSESNMKNAS